MNNRIKIVNDAYKTFVEKTGGTIPSVILVHPMFWDNLDMELTGGDSEFHQVGESTIDLVETGDNEFSYDHSSSSRSQNSFRGVPVYRSSDVDLSEIVIY